MNPGILAVRVLLSAVLLLIVPIVIASCAKSYMTETKYFLYSILGNLVVEAVIALVVQGSLSSFNPAALVLWTAVGCLIGKKILKKNGLYLKKGETPPADGINNMSRTNSFTGNVQQDASSQQTQYNYYNSQQYNTGNRQQYNGSNQQQYNTGNRQQYNAGSQQQYNSQARSDTPKFCPRCGNQLSSGSRFCSKCGADVMK